MEKEEIQTKIAIKQIEINGESDQNKKNELYQDLKILNMRKDMETTHDDIKRLTNRD